MNEQTNEGEFTSLYKNSQFNTGGAKTWRKTWVREMYRNAVKKLQLTSSLLSIIW